MSTWEGRTSITEDRAKGVDFYRALVAATIKLAGGHRLTLTAAGVEAAHALKLVEEHHDDGGVTVYLA